MEIRHEEGVAMIMAMAAMLLMSALGMVLVLTTSSESAIAANFRDASEGIYAADAALERSLDDLRTLPDWDAVLTGSVRSAFVDGAPGGTRTLADGFTIDLDRVVSMADCGKTTACSDAEMDAITAQRPWGSNNPRWQLYAYGNLREMLPGHTIDSSYYVIVMVGDDPSETDGRPLQDGIETAGEGVLALRAEALGPRGAHRIVEMTVARSGVGEGGVRVLSWREVR
jgi:hypothetical protein